MIHQQADSRVLGVHVTIKGYSAEFTQKMVDAVTVGLEPLGSSGRSATIYFIDKRNGVGLTDAFANPSRFLAALDEMFGLGAKILELSIAKAVANAFGLQTAPTSLVIAVKESARQYKASGSR
jgi:hypothetical protein